MIDAVDLAVKDLARSIAERDRLLAASYFLVDLRKGPELWTCGRCGGKHAYLTLNCTPRPISGLANGLHLYMKTVEDRGALPFLSPEQRAHLERLSRLLGPQPDLATAHPLTARALNPEPNTASLASAAAGYLEPISRERAIRYVEAIIARGVPDAERLTLLRTVGLAPAIRAPRGLQAR